MRGAPGFPALPLRCLRKEHRARLRIEERTPPGGGKARHQRPWEQRGFLWPVQPLLQRPAP